VSCIPRKAPSAIQLPKSISAILVAVSTMWPNRVAKATPASQTTSDQQSRHNVTDAGGLECCACRLAPRPAALSRDQDDRHLVIGNHSVQNADRSGGADQLQLWRVVHQSPSPSCRCPNSPQARKINGGGPDHRRYPDSGCSAERHTTQLQRSIRLRHDRL